MKCLDLFDNDDLSNLAPLYIITNIDNWYIPGTTHVLYHIYKALKRRPLMTYKKKTLMLLISSNLFIYCRIDGSDIIIKVNIV